MASDFAYTRYKESLIIPILVNSKLIISLDQIVAVMTRITSLSDRTCGKLDLCLHRLYRFLAVRKGFLA